MWDALQPWWPNGPMWGLHWLVSWICKVILIFNLFRVCPVVLFYVSGLWYVQFCRYLASSWWKYQFFIHVFSLFFWFHSSSYFGLQPVSSRNQTFQFILCALSGPHLFRVLLFLFRLFSVPLYWCALTIYLSRFLA